MTLRSTSLCGPAIDGRPVQSVPRLSPYGSRERLEKKINSSFILKYWTRERQIVNHSSVRIVTPLMCVSVLIFNSEVLVLFELRTPDEIFSECHGATSGFFSAAVQKASD